MFSYRNARVQDAYLYYLLECAAGRMSCEADGRELAPGRALVFCRSIATARRLHDLLSLLFAASSRAAPAASRNNNAAASSTNERASAPATELTWAPHKRRRSQAQTQAPSSPGIGAARVQLLHARMQQRQRLKNLERFQGVYT